MAREVCAVLIHSYSRFGVPSQSLVCCGVCCGVWCGVWCGVCYGVMCAVVCGVCGIDTHCSHFTYFLCQHL